MNSPESASEHRYPALTGLRGFAALWVLSYHAWEAAGPAELALNLPVLGLIEFHPIFGVGWAGVQVFFALSAFLLTLPLARASLIDAATMADKRSFFLKRWVRVFPAYYLQLLILLLIASWIDLSVPTDSAAIFHLLSMNFMPEPLGYGLRNSINGVWWTLPVELSFYLALPFLAPVALGKNRWKVFLVLGLVMLGWRYQVIQTAPMDTKVLWFSQLPGSIDSFAMGMICAYVFANYENSSLQLKSAVMRYSGLLIAAASILIIAMVYWLDYIYWLYRTDHLISYIWTPMLCLGFSILIFFAALEHPLLNKVFANRFLFRLGVISYGIYLWHLPVARWFAKTTFVQDADTYLFPHYLLVMVIGATLLAALSWFLVEKPCIQRMRSYLQKQKRSP